MSRRLKALADALLAAAREKQRAFSQDAAH